MEYRHNAHLPARTENSFANASTATITPMSRHALRDRGGRSPFRPGKRATRTGYAAAAAPTRNHSTLKEIANSAIFHAGMLMDSGQLLNIPFSQNPSLRLKACKGLVT